MYNICLICTVQPIAFQGFPHPIWLIESKFRRVFQDKMYQFPEAVDLLRKFIPQRHMQNKKQTKSRKQHAWKKNSSPKKESTVTVNHCKSSTSQKMSPLKSGQKITHLQWRHYHQQLFSSARFSLFFFRVPRDIFGFQFFQNSFFGLGFFFHHPPQRKEAPPPHQN